MNTRQRRVQAFERANRRGVFWRLADDLRAIAEWIDNMADQLPTIEAFNKRFSKSQVSKIKRRVSLLKWTLGIPKD